MGQRRVIVVGGSLCGLLTANLLHRDGWKVDIYERVADELAGRGAGIVTHPALLEALTRCGIAVDDNIGVTVSGRVTLGADGAVVGMLDMAQIMTSWARLFALLKAQVPAGSYHSGHGLEGVEQNAGSVTAIFANGKRAEADLLIGTDGIRSTVRARYLPAVVPQYAGYVAWRGLVEEKEVSPRTHADLFERLAFCLPTGEQMLGYPVAGAANATVQGQRRYNWVWYRPAAEDTTLADMLTDATGRRHDISIPPPLTRADVIDAMRRDADRLLAPQFQEIVRLTQQPFFQPIYDVESPQLVFGRVVIAGDAAFVARPHCGMGVTKAGGDAVALADALKATDDLDAALRRFEQLRVRFGTAVLERARHLGAYMQAQIRTAAEREMAERYRTPEAVMRETAVPEHLWGVNPA